MIYGIDFDGTIVEEIFPEIGEPIVRVVDFIRELQERGDKWILITMREGKYLDEAVEWLKAELNNALMILKQLDWLYSEENENAMMWELKIDGLSPTEWMCDIVRKSREFIANAPDTNDGRKESEGGIE
jgi:hypothetical protein